MDSFSELNNIRKSFGYLPNNNEEKDIVKSNYLKKEYSEIRMMNTFERINIFYLEELED